MAYVMMSEKLIIQAVKAIQKFDLETSRKMHVTESDFSRTA